jgi:hypothetical protein
VTPAELELLRQISTTGTSFAVGGTESWERAAFRARVQRLRSLADQGMISIEFLFSKRPLEPEPLAVHCSLSELGQLTLAAHSHVPSKIAYTVDREAHTVRVTARGVLSAAEYEAHVRELAAAGVFGYRRVADYREAEIDVRPDAVVRLVTVVRALRRAHHYPRTAYLTREGTLYGMLRMFEATHRKQDRGFRVFLDEEEAEGWIRG